MMAPQKVPHLKNNNGSWSYRRRVPERHHATMGFKVWNQPCGKVSYADAVSMVAKWTKEHDDLIKRLDDPRFADKTRYVTEVKKAERSMMMVADTITDIGWEPGEWPADQMLEGIRVCISTADQHPEENRAARLVGYRSVYLMFFGDHVVLPKDTDDREEYDLLKRKLERRIADLDGNPNTISAVSERAFNFARIKAQVRNKYRRSIRQLIDHTGDIPLPHLTGAKLREFREAKTGSMKASSVQSLFTPIRTMLKFAVENEIIENNPMPNVTMPRETRSVNSIKWKPFNPEEAQRIFEAMDRVWGKPVPNMSDERRKAIWWAVRVQAFTAMRPKEVVDLKPENVDDRWIKIEESKTDGSDRTIPLHPEIAGFVEFFQAGGFETFNTQEKDKVQTVRHNFQRLIEDFMEPPIVHPQKVLYSWRSTFSNTMRRAGADHDIRRAILGHTLAGSLAHYDDGPEFALKRKWIRVSDPRKIYPDAGEDDDLV